MDWTQEVIKKLEKLKPRTRAIENAIHVFKNGQGWLTADNPIKIFFWSDFDDRNAVK